ncbi:MAG: hypothetical protein K2Y23_05450 [Cyanobacteria bacterium]|nr:hypothetical protein [Cyanobacteriota bacterium]
MLLLSLWGLHQHEGHQPAPRAAAKVDPVAQPAKVLGWEPIRCWRQATAGAVTIGESFTVVLTCAVYEADNAQVIPDESRLGVASVQMAPFEILGGAHPPDVRRGSRRFFQYDYQLRIISRDAIGHDVNIPALPISYRIHSRVGAAATLEGRDLEYVMPMMPIRVLSLVPAGASDIRDASEASLAAVDSMRFRSSVFRALAVVFGALAAVMVVLALLPLARSKSVTAEERHRVPDRAILDRAAEDLAAVQARANAEGWSEEHVASALALMRVIAAAAIDQPITQQPVAEAKAPDGRLVVHHGVVRKFTVSVSSPVTADDVMRAAVSSDAFSATRRLQLEGLQSGLSAMTNALYRKDPARDPSSLYEAVRQAIAVARDVAGERRWQGMPWARR